MPRDRRRSARYAALGFCLLPDLSTFPEVTALKRWMSTWTGIGDVVAGMERQGFVVSRRRLVDDGWTASFHAHAMLAPDGIRTAPTPYEAVQIAAWRAVNPPAHADARKHRGCRLTSYDRSSLLPPAARHMARQASSH